MCRRRALRAVRAPAVDDEARCAQRPGAQGRAERGRPQRRRDRRRRRRHGRVNETVKVACVQAEPVILDRSATIDRLAALAFEAAEGGAKLALFPEAFIPFYPSSRWARHLTHWEGNAKKTFGRLAEQSLRIPGPDVDRIAAVA